MTQITEDDAVARLHAAFSQQTSQEFATMETLKTKYMKTPRDAVVSAALNELLANAVQREHMNLPASFENRGRGSGLAIVGPTGTGKSKFLENFFDKHPVLAGYRNPVSASPLLSVSSPSPCTLMQLARVILVKSGYKLERDLPAHRLWEMVFERMHHLRKFLLHVDELQHVPNTVSEREMQTLADLLKNSMYGQRISLIVSGVDTLVPFLQFDSQLFRRLTIVPFRVLGPDNLPEVERTVFEYAKAAGLQVETRFEEALYARLAHAALSAFGYTIVITHLAIKNALHLGSPVLSREHYANAFAAKTGFPADRNPFLSHRWFEIDCAALFEKKDIPPPPKSSKRSGR